MLFFHLCLLSINATTFYVKNFKVNNNLYVWYSPLTRVLITVIKLKTKRLFYALFKCALCTTRTAIKVVLLVNCLNYSFSAGSSTRHRNWSCLCIRSRWLGFARQKVLLWWTWSCSLQAEWGYRHDHNEAWHTGRPVSSNRFHFINYRFQEKHSDVSDFTLCITVEYILKNEATSLLYVRQATYLWIML